MTKGYKERMKMMANPLFDALFAPLKTRHGPLFRLPDGATLSGAAFFALIASQAHALRAAGVGVGDRVAAQVAKSPDALATYGACMALGAIYLPLNTGYTATEMDYFIGDARPAVLVCDPANAEALQGVADRHGAVLLTMDAGGAGSLATLAAGGPADIVAVDRRADDLAALLYTSGTTGRAKGAMLSQGNLLSNAQVLVNAWRFTDHDVLLHALPIFHTHGLFVATNVSLLSGGQMIFLPGFEVATVLRLLPQASVMMGVPTFYTRLLGDVRFDRALVAHMRLFVSGSAPLLTETHRAFAARTGQVILERYGMTETNMNTSNPHDGARRAGTVGMALPGIEVRLVEGVIEVRGPNVFQGYWGMPEKTAEALRSDGWFITGDLGRMGADGYLEIVGRAKDLVITGGYNVYPREVEMALDAAPGVVESAVIGVVHPDFGEAVFAVIVGDVTVEGCLAAVAGSLARFKQPKAGVVVAALPRNAMGKVQKAVLREAYAGWFAAK
jgi:malonyl-CoA/methylmalonyl-CoA synthetase